MEKFDNMKQNMVNDEELDQISGGINLFNIFTADFHGKAGEATTLEMNPEDENNHFSVSTLEMRTNPLDKKEKKNTQKTIKI